MKIISNAYVATSLFFSDPSDYVRVNYEPDSFQLVHEIEKREMSGSWKVKIYKDKEIGLKSSNGKSLKYDLYYKPWYTEEKIKVFKGMTIDSSFRCRHSSSCIFGGQFFVKIEDYSRTAEAGEYLDNFKVKIINQD